MLISICIYLLLYLGNTIYLFIMMKKDRVGIIGSLVFFGLNQGILIASIIYYMHINQSKIGIGLMIIIGILCSVPIINRIIYMKNSK